MNSPEYLTKFRASTITTTITTEVAGFLAYFERLNQHDWSVIIRDVFDDSPAVHEIFRPNLGESLTATVKVTIGRLGMATQRLVAAALFQIVRDVLTRTEANEECDSLPIQLIRFATVLPSECCVQSLLSLAKVETMPRPLRWEVFRALGTFATQVPVCFWKHIPLNEYPDYAGIVLRALSQYSPAQALQKLAGMDSCPPDAASLEYPLRVCLRKFSQNPTETLQLWRIMEVAPPWLKRQVEEMLLTSEFNYLHRSENREVWISTASGWDNYCRSLGDNIYYSYFGYFAYTQTEMPDCFRTFLIEFRREVAAVQSLEPDSVQLTPVKIVSNNATVDSVFSWQTVLLEPGYLTAGRSRNKDVKQLGTVSRFGLVAPKRARSWLEFMIPSRIDLDKDFKLISNFEWLACEARKKTQLLTLSRMYHVIRSQSYKVIVQPSTANEDEITILLQDLIHNRGANPNERPSQISELQDINAAMIPFDSSDGRCAALLDWRFAIELVKLSSGMFDLYVVSYDKPVPVGYFYPKNDDKWGAKIDSIYNRAIRQNTANYANFTKYMNIALVDMVPKQTDTSLPPAILSKSQNSL